MKNLLPFMFVIVARLVAPGEGLAADAPGSPGADSTWAPAAKDFVGSAVRGPSRVAFTGAEGVLTEVFYPTLDQVQNVDMQFLVTDASRTWGDEERRQRRHDVTLVQARALLWKSVTTADSGRWRITRKVFTDPERDSVIQRVSFETLEAGKTVQDYNLYLLGNPSIHNSGSNDVSRAHSVGGRTLLVAEQAGAPVASALGVSVPWRQVGGSGMVSSGYVGRSDGWTDLFGGGVDRKMDWTHDAVAPGNVAQLGWVDLGAGGTQKSFDVVLAFGNSPGAAALTAVQTLAADRDQLEARYVADWTAYCAGLQDQGGHADDLYYLAAMCLKCSQDRSNGAMVAGLGTPWGAEVGDANDGGYHLVWARDLFKFASALLIAGDTESTARAVDYLFDVQMQTVDRDGDPFSRAGRFPQNSYIDGRRFFKGTQLDESAMPIILAWRLHQVAPLNLAQRWPRIKLAAEFVARTGPITEQERWEEINGYSPSTIAAEVAGLVCAASLAREAGDTGAAEHYLKTADRWRNNVAGWTFTTRGSLEVPAASQNRRHYLRITAGGDPDGDGSYRDNNGSGTHAERSIIDGGFLELVRLGAMSAADWTVLETLPEYDAALKRTIPSKGDAWFRYNFDGYGERNDGSGYRNNVGCGRLWPIFTAERGIYEIERARDGARGAPYRQALRAFASPAGLIPEQVWPATTSVTGWLTQTPEGEVPGTATRSIRPLNWAMGEYINLVAAIASGRGDAPKAVTDRYRTDQPQVTVVFVVTASTVPGQNVYLTGDSPLMGAWTPSSGVKLDARTYPNWTVTISLPANAPFSYKFVKVGQNGTTDWEHVPGAPGGNRTLTTPASGTITRTATFQ